jgi:hypothetical protein
LPNTSTIARCATAYDTVPDAKTKKELKEEAEDERGAAQEAVERFEKADPATAE